MAVIVWDAIGTRFYEGGVDRGVLYTPGGIGVAWNGLISVSTEIRNVVEPTYYDGVKVNNVVTVGDFEGTLKAYTYPDEFLAFEGVLQDDPGLFLTGQQPTPFHLSYRTRVGNDILGFDLGYKINLLWNLIATPVARDNETLSIDSEPLEFEWSLTSVPEEAIRFEPTSHLIIDSRKVAPALLTEIETLIYGSGGTTPQLPSLINILELSET